VLPDGTIKHLHSIAHPVMDDSGEIAEVVGTVVDVTERKRAEEALQRSEAYLAEAQRLTHTGSWAYKAGGREGYWSEENFRIWGFDPRQGLQILNRCCNGYIQRMATGCADIAEMHCKRDETTITSSESCYPAEQLNTFKSLGIRFSVRAET